MSLLLQKAILEEPESEVHSVEEQKERFEEEMKMKEKVLLGDLVTFQSTKLIQMRETEEPQFPGSSHCETKDESKTEKLQAFGSLLDSKFSWSDDDNSELEGYGLSIHDSILAIQKEASKVDAIMAVDQLDTLKEELRTLRRQLNNRTAEVEELQALVHLKDSRIGTLELERDLYKADTAELQNDLKKCISRLNGASSFLSDEADSANIMAPEPQDNIVSSKPSSIVTATTDASLKQQTRPRPLDPPSCADSFRSASESADTRTTFSGSFQSSRQLQSVPNFPVCEKPNFTSEAIRSQKTRSLQLRLKGRAFPFCRSASHKQSKLVHKASREMESVSISLQEQVEEMSQRLTSSIASSEELRRRLAMLSQYYEGVVNDLKDSIVDIKEERMQMEFDLTRQLSSIDRENKTAVSHLEAKLKEKEEQMEVLKQQQTSPASFSGLV